jgi:thiamine-monophosphate kinase
MALSAIAGEFRASARERSAFEARLHSPLPRVALGLALRGIAHGAIDVSDGLLADLGHICERSRVGAVVQWESIPANPLVRARAQTDRGAQALLAGGDDYELCFTASPRRNAEVVRAAARAKVAVTRIGRIVPHPKVASLVQVLDAVGKPLRVRARGYDHFG